MTIMPSLVGRLPVRIGSETSLRNADGHGRCGSAVRCDAVFARFQNESVCVTLRFSSMAKPFM